MIAFIRNIFANAEEVRDLRDRCTRLQQERDLARSSAALWHSRFNSAMSVLEAELADTPAVPVPPAANPPAIWP